MTRRIATALVAALAVTSGALAGCGDDPAQPSTEQAGDEIAEATYEYVIPAGAGEALDAGEPLEILPGELEVRVGETIRIVNEDDRGHAVGPFFVGANEVLTQRFASEGEFVGICTVHPSGEFVLVVRA